MSPPLTQTRRQPLQSAPSRPLLPARAPKPKPPKPECPFNIFEQPCELERFDPDHKCSGVVVRCHLIKEQVLINQLGFTRWEAWDPDFWTPGCNGIAGVGGHHWRLDNGHIKFERRDLPVRLERRGREDERIGNKLDLLYGERPVIGRAT